MDYVTTPLPKEYFKTQCNKGYCLRHISISNTCQKEVKQDKCYDKYILFLEKQIVKKQESFEKQIEKQRIKKQESFEKQIEKQLIKKQEYMEKELQKNKLKMEQAYNERRKELEDYFLKKERGETVEYESQDEKWDALKNEILIRDNGTCRFYSLLTKEEKEIIDIHLYGDFKLIDGAHCIPRSKSKKLKYERCNCYCLYRYVHICLDNYIDPFTGLPCTKEKIEEYWIRIIGIEIYTWLQKNK